MLGAGIAPALADLDRELMADPAWMAPAMDGFPQMFTFGLEGYADDRIADGPGWIEFDVARVRCPVVVLHGTEDKATKYQGSQFFYEHAGSADKTLKLYDGHYHDMLNDIGKEQVMADIAGWLAAHA